MDRDPRETPMAGDVLEKARTKDGVLLRRRVQRPPEWMRTGPDIVRFGEFLPGEKYSDIKGASLTVWRSWSRTATVIKRADEPVRGE